MSVEERQGSARRDPASYVVAGYLAAAALFASAIALVYYPGRIGPGAMLISLIAAAMGGPHRRLAGAAVAASTVCWLVGMIIAILLDRPIF